MSIKNTLKSFLIILCKPFKALKEDYESKLANSDPAQFTQKEYEEFCRISKSNEKFDKGEI